jgi:hypothetical protein
MNALREKLITEIQHIPDSRLQEIFDVIHYFRLGLNSAQAEKPVDIRQFAGAWADMDDTLFAEWDAEWRERRRLAFSRRAPR